MKRELNLALQLMDVSGLDRFIAAGN